MIEIKPECLSCRLSLELILIGILLFYFIIKILLTDWYHWLLYIIQSSTSPLNFFTWCNLCICCYWFLWRWADNIGWNDYLVLDLLQKNYWIQIQVKPLTVKWKIKALLASEVVNFIPKTPPQGLGKSFTLTGYSSVWMYFTQSRLD